MAAKNERQDLPSNEVGSDLSTEQSTAPESLDDSGAMTDEGPKSFPIVGIGASAGGLKAFEQFFQKMPKNSGMAFVLIQHLAPHHDSELAELLQNHTRMKVTQVENKTPVQPNHVYVIPPGKSLSIKERTLYLSEPVERRGHRAPIDLFFRSLADDQGENAICVVLSGTGTDGTLGLKAVKERAGITMAQSTTDADYDGMPKSAIRTGLVDLVGTAGELAEKLLSYKDSKAKIHIPEEEEALPEGDSEALTRIFAQLRAKTGHDFTHYKRSTILRRIGRRLQVNQISTMTEYLAYLRQNPDEVQALFKDFLISVTNFFRDPDAFAALEKQTISEIFQHKGSKNQIRVWVAGCATGEEAYSIAILLNEYASMLTSPPSIQVFATDIDDEAIAFAREGFYPESIAADISPERLRRFFVDEVGGYRVKKEIRETVLFAIHNLIEDAPFSKLDLISCRNLLIYLDRNVQEKVFELFHYALQPNGYLFLGSSETTDPANNLFTAKTKKQRIFKRRDTVSSPPRFPRLPLVKTDLSDDPDAHQKSAIRSRTLEELYQGWTLRRFAPPRLLINEDYEITHIFGGADRYLQEQEGPVTQNILQKIRPELRLDLRTALYQAFIKGERTASRYLHTEHDQQVMRVKLQVGPITEPGFPRNYVEVLFEEQTDKIADSANLTKTVDENATQLISRLEEEVQRTREQLQSTVEEYETSNEELKASNEELQSMNEEMQSTAEELETSKEELQSTNEELVTVNQELKNKIEELNQVNSDLQNLMSSTDIGTLFLDRHLQIKRFTPKIAELFNIISADIGRPFDHLSHKLKIDTLVNDAEYVLKTLSTVECEVQTKDNRWFMAKLLPYRTIKDKIDGVVMTFVDVTRLKQIEKHLQQRVRQQATVADLGQIALAGVELEALMQEATRQIAQALDVEFCKVLELQPENEQFLLKAGVGWKDGYVGQATVENHKNSQAGFTLAANEPVMVADLSQETRFKAPPLLTEHGISSGISVVINGIERPYAVLSAHSKLVRTYSQDDINFIVAVANIIADALERNQADAAIRQSQETIQQQLSEIEAIYATAPVGLAFMDKDLCYVRINERLAEINGLSVAEHLDRTATELFPEMTQLTSPYIDQAIAGERVLDVELHGTTPAQPGVERDWLASYSPLKDEAGRVIGINTVMQEITELKKARQALEASEQRFRRAVQDAPFPILIHAEDGEIVMISRIVSDLTGHTFDEIPTVEAWVNHVYNDSDFRQRVVEGIKKLYDLDHRIDEGEFELTTREGDHRIWHFSSAPLGTDERNRRLVISMASDVTKRKEFEVALQNNQQRLKDLNETLEQRVTKRTEELTRIINDLDQFAYVASHDLKTPLRAIDNLATWISEDATDSLSDTSKDHLEKMRDRVKRMEMLLNDLLDYSRAGREVNDLEEVDTGDLINNILTILTPPEAFTITVSDHMPTLVTSRMLLEMVFRNLIDNAVKHHHRADGRIEISAQESEHSIEFIIKDDGPGIDPNYHERIFQIFQTLQPKDVNGGTGMGLAIVRKIVEAQEGQITIESAPGQGSAFHFTWPKGAN
ncbi:MAG: PAS domain-containing protein [Anaerolineales bacterium]|nr:PAS domain-containing protein [Anaerolineales bacterium]